MEVAEDEKRRRGPSSVIRNRKEMKSYKNWDDIKKEMIECFAIKPTLCMFSTNSAKKDSHLQSMFDLTYMLFRETLLLEIFKIFLRMPLQIFTI